MGAVKRTPAHYHALALQRRFIWLDEGCPATAKHKTTWRCSIGHTWQANYSDVASGRGCPHCAHKLPKTVAQYHALAASIGYLWVGSVLPDRVQYDTQWICTNGHTWTCTYQRIERGTRCLYCSSVAPKVATDYHALALRRGFEWIGTSERLSVNKPTAWRCPQGHEWSATYKNIHLAESGCPRCSGYFKRELEDYRALAEQYNYTFIDQVPTYVHDKALWRCSYGHEWRTTFSTISQGHGCPRCAWKANGARTRKEPSVKRLTSLRRRERKRALPNTLTEDAWRYALDYFNHCCAVCGRPQGLWHNIVADHWIPLLADDCPGTVPANCIPLCNGKQGCNSSKRATRPEVWLECKFGKRRASEILTRINAYFDHLLR